MTLNSLLIGGGGEIVADPDLLLYPDPKFSIADLDMHPDPALIIGRSCLQKSVFIC
jgi:hypothetical protein